MPLPAVTVAPLRPHAVANRQALLCATVAAQALLVLVRQLHATTHQAVACHAATAAAHQAGAVYRAAVLVAAAHQAAGAVYQATVRAAAAAAAHRTRVVFRAAVRVAVAHQAGAVYRAAVRVAVAHQAGAVYRAVVLVAVAHQAAVDPVVRVAAHLAAHVVEVRAVGRANCRIVYRKRIGLGRFFF